MSIAQGPQNHWQTGAINGAPHAVEKCGSHTGHAVRAVAFCDTAETAELLVEALKHMKDIHEHNPNLDRDAKIKALLDRAGLI